MAINALSGGVDSSVVTMIGHMALGARLRTVFIQNGLMREGEPETVASVFEKLGVKVKIIDAQQELRVASCELRINLNRRSEFETRNSKLTGHPPQQTLSRR